MPDKRKRVALYARVSTTRDQNPALQLEELRAVAAQRGWHVVGEYVDKGVSGAKDRRPELDKMLHEVGRGRIDVVAVWKFDRFARSVRHLVWALEDFRVRGVDFVSVQDNIDTSTPVGKLAFHILAAMAEFERDLIRDRTKAGLESARRRGARLGRPSARIDAEVLREMKADGKSLREIGSALGVGAATVLRILRRQVTARV